MSKKEKTGTGKGSPDREPNGKFKPGHGVKSPGNPDIKKSAALRRAIKAAVTPEEMQLMFRKLLAQAVTEGCTASARLLAEYAVGKPAPISEEVAVQLPPIKTAKDMVEAVGVVTTAVGAGAITLDQAKTLGDIIAAAGRVLEVAEMEERIRKLEAAAERVQRGDISNTPDESFA